MPQAADGRGLDGGGGAVAGDGDRGECGGGGEPGQAGQLVSPGAGPAALAGPGRRERVQRGVLAQPVVQVMSGGSFFSWPPA
jgi:hypothetical protein